MKKVVFGITSLEIGGAERVLVDLANRLKEEYDITIFTLYGNGDLEKELDDKIKVVSLYKNKYKELSFFEKKKISLIFSSNYLMHKIYKRYIKDKFDTEIAFLEGPITSLFALSSSSNKIAWVHTNLAKHINNNFRKNKYENDYKHYKNIVFVSNDALNGFNEIFDVGASKRVIHNYMDVDIISKKALEYNPKEIDNSVPTFLAVCRLVKAKGIDRLVLVSKKLLESGYKHKIYIIGDGPEQDNIEKMINSLDIKDNFILLGKKENPYPYIKKAQYFILPSLYEGYGMVLIEAMALKKDILITDTGSKEALIDYENKMIVNNSLDGLYNGMKIILEKGFNHNKKVKSSYDTESIIEEIKLMI